MAASSHNQQLCVKLALEAKAVVDDTNEEGYTALHLATKSNHIDLFSILLKGGASINSRTRDEGETPLILASENNNVGCVERLLDLKADINAQDSVGETALTSAARDNFPDVVKLLIVRKINPLLCTTSGKTPLEIADERKHELIVKFILNASETNTLLREAIRTSKYKQLKEVIFFALELLVGDPALSLRLSRAIKSGKWKDIDEVNREAIATDFGDAELLEKADATMKVSETLSDALRECELGVLESALAKAQEIKFGDTKLMDECRQAAKGIIMINDAIHSGDYRTLKAAIEFARKIALNNIVLLERSEYHLDTSLELNRALWRWERFKPRLMKSIKRAIRCDFGNRSLIEDAKILHRLEVELETGDDVRIAGALELVRGAGLQVQ